MTDALLLKEIESVADPACVEFLKLIECSFPPDEIMAPSFWVRLLQQIGFGTSRMHMFVVQAASGNGGSETSSMAGLLMYETQPEANLVYLWYLAVAPNCRRQGIGTWILNRLTDILRQDSNYRAIQFEIEHLDYATDDSHRQEMRDRERFYQRWGAKIARNIDYLQSVGDWHPPKPMYLCVYPLDPDLTNEEIRQMFVTAFPKEDGGGIQNLPEDIGLE